MAWWSVSGPGARSWALTLALLPVATPARDPRPPQAAAARKGPGDPWDRAFPGLDPIPGLTDMERKLAQSLERDPALPRSPELKELMEAARLEQRIAGVTANLPWQEGPAELALAGAVHFHLPKGFKFVDAPARAGFYAALGRKAPPVSDFETPLGTVMSLDQTRLATLVLLHLGHTDDRGPLPADTILAELNNHRGETAQALHRLQHPQGRFILPRTIRWLLAPVVDPQRHTLAWARTGDPSLGEHDQFSFVRFGRDTCLLLESPCPDQASDLDAHQAQLRSLLEAMTFLPGQTYEDHRGPSGDLTLRVLVRGPQTAAESKSEALKQFPAAVPASPSFWAFLGANAVRIIAVLSLSLAAFTAWRRHRKPRNAQGGKPGGGA